MTRGEDLGLRLDPASRAPLYLQVAEAVAGAIHDGRLRAGMALPGVRDLARSLGVTVNTILAALREAQAQGLLTAQERAGFFVAAAPRPPQAAADDPRDPGFDLPAHLRPVTSTADVRMDFTEGLADPRLAPFQALGRAYQRGLRLHGPRLLGDHDPMGLPRLREALAAHLEAHKGLRADPGRILLVRTTAMAVTVAAQALADQPGARIALEDPGSPDLRETLRQACPASLVGIPVDAGGARVEALQAALAEGPLNLLVLSPQVQHPTGARLAEDRRGPILDLARQGRFPILELDPEGDYLEAPDPLAGRDAGQVLHVGGLSRVFAPGLGLAYVVAPEPLAPLLARARRRIDWQGDPVTDWALSELILDGEMRRQVLRARKAAQERADALEDALGHAMAGRLDWVRGATALWLRGQGPLALPAAFQAWVKACQAQGLKLRPGRAYHLDGRDAAATRMGFTAFTPEELQRAVAMMA